MDYKFPILSGDELRNMGLQATGNGLHKLHKVPAILLASYYEGVLDIELPEHYVVVHEDVTI